VEKTHERSASKTVAKLVIGFGLAISGIASGQQAAAVGAPPHSEGEIIEFPFAGLTWRMPKRIFQGIRPFSENTQELTLDLVWDKKSNSFYPVGLHPGGMRLGVEVRTLPIGGIDFEGLLADSPNGMLEKRPAFVAGKFSGMTYLGSLSILHIFALSDEDAYVSCMLPASGRLPPGQVAPDVLSKKFHCYSMFRLPRSTYARVTGAWMDLNDVGPAFTSVYRETLSFIR
jgi:hypothetical protein